MCFSQTTGPFSVDAASIGVQRQVMCSPWALSIYVFSGGVRAYARNSCVHAHIPTHRMQRYRWHRGRLGRHLKIQQNPDVRLIPHTFKKPVPRPLPACSTQATFQCLLLYLSLELQYYREASGRLVLPYASQAHSGKVFTAQTTPFQTVKMSKLSHCHHFSSIIRKSFHLSSMTIVYTYCQQPLAYKIFITLNVGRLVNALLWWGNQEMKS